MAKEKTVYVCSNCGQDSPKWVGKCPSCGEWNTLVEELVQKSSGTKDLIDDLVHRDSGRKKTFPQLLQDIVPGQNSRSDTRDGELNRVLGGGLVSGSLVLIGGQPGIGKSTLLLQLAMRYGKTVLYVSGEESEEQIQMRAQRITGDGSQCFIYTETDLTEILRNAPEYVRGKTGPILDVFLDAHFEKEVWPKISATKVVSEGESEIRRQIQESLAQNA